MFQDAEDSHAHLCALVDFALVMKARLEDVNTHSFNNFKLRVGRWPVESDLSYLLTLNNSFVSIISRHG